MKKKMKVWMTIIFDCSMIIATVAGNYFYNYKMPHHLESLNQTVSSTTSESTVNSQPDTPVPTASSNDWSNKFANFFTADIISTDMAYSSPDVAIQIKKMSYGTQQDTVTYFVADIHIADIYCFKTKFAQDTYGIGYTEGLTSMSQSVNAILAINGDSYDNDHHKDSGTIIRNGVMYREAPTSYDICVLYKNGIMKTYHPDQLNIEQTIADNAFQTWIFGPALLDENGDIPTSYNIWDYIRQAHPRTAIGYYEPGHYCMVLVDGRQTDTCYSRGMTLEELSMVFKNLGCKAAYNLDGGHCSFMTFKNQIVNHPYKMSDDISDCIYIGEP